MYTGDRVPCATRFLALDKCLPNRDFLQIVDFPDVNPGNKRPLQIEIDEEWMAIVKCVILVVLPESFVQLLHTDAGVC